MDFDLSKENIQPLRSGRNVTQLGIALQAQTSQEYQRELMQQKEEYENAIRNYDGDDPLDNWYHYISWVEQSYPKHGHEGNLAALLEDCLSKFEFDKRYTNDRRFCKLWIKYIDLLPNPLELYHMLHARGLCQGCADLYRAWSYYHEAAGDYRNANLVFELGLRELAQPYQELVNAHQNMVLAAGQHMISGLDERVLLEKRQALTSLQTFKPGRVGSVRKTNIAGPGVLVPDGSSSLKGGNCVIPVFEDISGRDGAAFGTEAAPVSILTVAKRQEAPKENTMKPGPWTTVPVKKNYNVYHTPSFTIHEDGVDTVQKGIQLPVDYYPVTHEDLSTFKPQLCYPDPPDSTKIPMYPKSRVYIGDGTEYSIEEVRMQRYLVNRTNKQQCISHVETEQAIQSIIGDQHLQHMHDEQHLAQLNGSMHVQQNMSQHMYNQSPIEHHYVQQQGSVHVNEQLQQNQMQNVHQSYHQFSPMQHQQAMYPQQQSNPYDDHNQNMSTMHHNSYQQFHRPPPPDQNYHQQQPISSPIMHGSFQNKSNTNKNLWPQPPQSDHYYPYPSQSPQNNFDSIWRSPAHDSFTTVPAVSPKNNLLKFNIYEESGVSPQEHVQPKVSAMKTPFKVLNDDDFAETGSRGGLDAAAAAQPADSAKRLAVQEDDNNYEMNPLQSNFDTSCNTQMFNFNLNAMKVSTPQSKQTSETPMVDETNSLARKQLFTETAKLDTILEETKSYGSSTSNSSSSKLTSSNFSKRNNMAAISEEHNSYLAQNLKANAALRSSLLGEFMECQSQQSSPVFEHYPGPVLSPLHAPSPVPIVIKPLERAPSDPFKASLIKMLLDRIGFPGNHRSGYVSVSTLPRLAVRKEVVRIGDDKYIIDKQLGKGTYGTVFRGYNVTTGIVSAFKMQKPPNKWEFYICRELQARLAQHPLRERFMDVQMGYFSDQASLLISDFCPCGSLLDVVNTYKQKIGRATMKESLCVYFCIDMLKVVKAMHDVQIIHADIKPDNFLVLLSPDNTVQLQLIDFGCSIDMSLFPPGTTFRRRITTEDFICCEVRDGRPWSYHTDLFCVAATAHVLLFDKYIQLQKKDEHWSITQRLSRYMRVDLWNTFFSNLLNQQSGIADADYLRNFLEESLHNQFEDYASDMRSLVNLLKNR